MKQSKQNQIIFFFPDPQIGGVEKNFFLISKYLSNYFNNLSLITAKGINRKVDKKIYIIEINKFWSKINRKIFFIICSFKLFFECLKSKNSIIFSFQGNFYAILIAIILKKKIIIRSNLSPYGWKSSYIKIIIFKFLLSKANIIIVNSFDFKKQIKELFNVNCDVIYNPLNSSEIKKKSFYKKKLLFYKKKTINLINVGRLVDQKNQIEILKAIKKLDNLINNYRLLIIGDGPKKKELEDYIILNSLQKYVKIIYTAKAVKYIKMADVFILSSKYEGLPNVLLEAATLNKYIISTNCKTGPSEILKQYKYGELYAQGNIKQLYTKLKKLKKNFLNKKRNKSQNLKLFNLNHNLKKYLRLVKKLN